MAEHNEFGKEGENRAVAYLEEKNYLILQRNWVFGKLEIDIIAEDLTKNQLAIIEVKARTNPLIEPEEAVNLKKKRFLIKAADEFIQTHEIDLECRFDIIAVERKENDWTFTHFEDAFRPYEI